MVSDNIHREHRLDSRLLVLDGVVGQHGRPHDRDSTGGYGPHLPRSWHFDPGPDYVGYRGPERFRRYGRFLFSWQQHFRRYCRVSNSEQ